MPQTKPQYSAIPAPKIVYAFGSTIAERSVSFGAEYRYGFNNQEKDGEMGDYYAFEYRLHDARLGRFLSVDPLAPEYPWNSSYAFAENTVIMGIDLEGLELFVMTDGTDGASIANSEYSNTTVYNMEGTAVYESSKAAVIQTTHLETDVITIKENKQVEKILVTKYNSDAISTKYGFTFGLKPGYYFVQMKSYEINKLDINKSDFLGMAGWVNNETHTVEAGSSFEEKAAVANTIQNRADAKKETLSVSLGDALDQPDIITKDPLKKGKTFRENYTTKILSETNAKNRTVAYRAVLHVINHGEDYSNGATMWDGIEQAHTDGNTCVGNYTYHAAVMGWTISDEHFKIWKASIDKYSGKDYFIAPQNSVGKSCANSYNVGKMRLKSAACYGTTIFWIEREGEKSNNKHNGKTDGE